MPLSIALIIASTFFIGRNGAPDNPPLRLATHTAKTATFLATFAYVDYERNGPKKEHPGNAFLVKASRPNLLRMDAQPRHINPIGMAITPYEHMVCDGKHLVEISSFSADLEKTIVSDAQASLGKLTAKNGPISTIHLDLLFEKPVARFAYAGSEQRSGRSYSRYSETSTQPDGIRTFTCIVEDKTGLPIEIRRSYRDKKGRLTDEVISRYDHWQLDVELTSDTFVIPRDR